MEDKEHCCAECFKDEYIRNFIIQEGKKGKCDVCGRDNVFVVSFDLVADFIIEGFRRAYETLENEGFWHPEEKRYCDSVTGNDLGQSMFEALYYVEEIFSDDLDEKTAKNFLQKIMNSIKPSFREIVRGDGDLYSDIESPNWMLIDELYYSGNKENEEKLFYSWDEFKEITRYNFRFFDVTNDNKREELLRKLENIFKKMKSTLLKGERLFRARVYNGSLKKLEQPKDIGPAPIEKTKSNRFSPAGISYMYLSGDIDTCIEEVVPQIKDNVIVGVFELKKNIEILDLTGNPVKSTFCKSYDHDTRMLVGYFINKFSEEISKPMGVNDNKEIEYIPTQVLSEYIRKLGYKGIKYGSSLINGKYNYVLFFGAGR